MSGVMINAMRNAAIARNVSEYMGGLDVQAPSLV
jgi:hypothetical protein